MLGKYCIVLDILIDTLTNTGHSPNEKYTHKVGILASVGHNLAALVYKTLIFNKFK